MSKDVKRCQKCCKMSNILKNVKNPDTIHFINFFQQMVREDQPIYFLAAGLHGKVEELENTEGLTFFYRAAKLKINPLDFTLIGNDYQKKLSVSKDVSELLELTKKKGSDWSRPRLKLIEKELIEPMGRGTVRFVLPRFDVFLEKVIDFS